MCLLKGLRQILAGTVVAVLLMAGPVAAADHVTTRTLAELKDEVIKRASEVPPRSLVDGMILADVREALSHISSLDRDEWALAWMTRQLKDRPTTAGARN